MIAKTEQQKQSNLSFFHIYPMLRSYPSCLQYNVVQCEREAALDFVHEALVDLTHFARLDLPAWGIMICPSQVWR